MQSHIPFGPALDDPLQARLILLERDLARGLIKERISLHEHLTRLLVLEDHVPDLGAPVLQPDTRHLAKELGAGLDIPGRLVDVDLLEEVRNG